MTTLQIPPSLKVLRQTPFLPVNQSAGGGVSDSGFEQVVANPGGRWKTSITFQVRTEADILAYRCFLIALNGRANDVLVGPRDGIRPHDLNGNPLYPPVPITWINGAYWSNGAGWAAPVRQTGILRGASQQSTSINFIPVGNTGVRPGHYIGIVDRIYMATTVSANADGVSQDVGIWPWLRAAVQDGDAVSLDNPLCRMRLSGDDDGALETTWKQASTVTMPFVEVLE